MITTIVIRSIYKLIDPTDPYMVPDTDLIEDVLTSMGLKIISKDYIQEKFGDTRSIFLYYDCEFTENNIYFATFRKTWPGWLTVNKYLSIYAFLKQEQDHYGKLDPQWSRAYVNKIFDLYMSGGYEIYREMMHFLHDFTLGLYVRDDFGCNRITKLDNPRKFYR